MKKITYKDFEISKEKSNQIIGKVLDRVQKQPEEKEKLVKEVCQVIESKKSSKRAKASSIFLLGKMKAEMAVEPIIDLIGQPILDLNAKRLSYGEADPLTALVMIGEKGLPTMHSKMNSISVSKIRVLASAIYLISKDTTFIQKEVNKRLKMVDKDRDKELLKGLLKDIKGWD